MTVCLLAPSNSIRDVTVLLARDGKPMPATAPAIGTPIPNTAWTIWKLALKDLKPGTAYQYKVSYLIGDKPESTPLHHFRTLDPAAKSLHAIAFNDTHMGDVVMASLLKHVKPDDFDFSLLLGDILEGSDVIDSWNRYVALLDGANKPIIFVRGNHDVRGAFAKQLPYIFDLPNLDPTKPWGEDQWQYSLQAGPVRFLALDTGEDDDDTTPLNSYKNPALWQKVRQRQAEWLKTTIATHPANPTPWRMLLTHMPLYNSPWCSIRSRNLWTPLLTEWKPDLALSGHDHTWRKPLPLPKDVPWPTLVGGGPAMNGGEEATMMILSADNKSLKVRLIGAKDGRQLTEFVREK